MITKLTEEQEAKLPIYRDKWLDIGLSTEQCDREKAERAIEAAYKIASLSPPKLFIWLKSPLEGSLVATFFVNERAQVVDIVGHVVGHVVDQVRGQVRNHVMAQVWGQVWGPVVDVVGQVRNHVMAQVVAQVRSHVVDQVRNQVWRACYGSHDSVWLSFYSFFRDAVGIDATKKLSPLMDVSKHCGWFWPFESLVICTEKPTAIKMDESNRIHSIGSMAIEYPDGFGVYAVHGTRIPKEWGEKKEEEWKPE